MVNNPVSTTSPGQTPGLVVDLDERYCEANGAAYLVHMLLVQKADADTTGEFARQAKRLKAVRLTLSDTGDSAVVFPIDNGLRVTSDLRGSQPVRIFAASRHIPPVTKVRLLGRWLIIGPPSERAFWRLVGDIATRKVRIRGLIRHYASAMRFLWLINLRQG